MDTTRFADFRRLMLRELDTQVFDAYNKCDMPAFARFFSPTVEFYHDDGGATFDSKTVVANTPKFICGRVPGHRQVKDR